MRKILFRAMQSILGDRTVSSEYAHRAVDCNTYKGSLTNFSCPEEHCKTSGTVRYIDIACCQGWNTPITKATSCGITVVAGQGRAYVTDDTCSDHMLPFQLLCPPAPMATSTQENTNSTRYVSYFTTESHTFFGKTFQSPPSINTQKVQLGQVTIQTNSSKPCNIYRIEATYSDGRVAANQPTNMIYLIAENVMGSHVDTPDAPLKIPSEFLFKVRNPPQDIKFVGRITSGVLVAASEKSFYFTLPDHPFAWIGHYDLEHHQALWMEVRGDDVVIFTDQDILVYSYRPSTEGASFEMRELFTDQTLTSIESVSQGNAGIIYAAHNSLMLLSGVPFGRNSFPNVKSIPAFTGFDWDGLEPSSVKGSIFGQYYIFSSNVGAYLIDFTDDTYQQIELMTMTELDLKGTIKGATAFNHDGNYVYWHKDGVIYRWNPYDMPNKRIDEYRPQTSSCCPFYYVTDKKEGWFSAGEMRYEEGSEFEISVYKERCNKKQLVRTVKQRCEPFRLNPCTVKSDFFVEIKGCGTVHSVSLDTSLTSLTNTQGRNNA